MFTTKAVFFIVKENGNMTS